MGHAESGRESRSAPNYDHEIVLGREGRDTLEIIWDNPWDVLFDLPIENDWYTRGNKFRTFVEHTSIAPDLNKLRVVLEGGNQ